MIAVHLRSLRMGTLREVKGLWIGDRNVVECRLTSSLRAVGSARPLAVQHVQVLHTLGQPEDLDDPGNGRLRAWMIMQPSSRQASAASTRA
jgi:hypothetical protein